MNSKISEQELNRLVEYIGIDNTSIREALQMAYQSGFDEAYSLF